MQYLHYICPTECDGSYTRAEFEELVNLFSKHDKNNSKTLGRHEISSLLDEYGIHQVSLDEAIAMMENQSHHNFDGSIDFKQFAIFMARFKKRNKARSEGINHPFHKFSNVAITLQTSIVTLDKEAKNRKMKVRYNRISSDLSNNVTVQLTLDGYLNDTKFYHTFEASGTCVREAKSKAASLAMKKFQSLLPGSHYFHGLLPSEYLNSFFKKLNLYKSQSYRQKETSVCKFIKPLLRAMVNDGFHPCHNKNLMHHVMAFIRFPYNKTSRKEGASLSSGTSLNNPLGLSSCLIEWMNECCKVGIDGVAVFRLLQEDQNVCLKQVQNSVVYSDIFRIQRLLRNELVSNTTDDDTNGHNLSEGRQLRNFWTCAIEGNLNEVDLYLCAGQDPDETSPHTQKETSCRNQSPLFIASCCGHKAICELLIQTGKCNLNLRDRMGRTAIQGAAKYKRNEIVKLLIKAGADLTIPDNYGNSPLHTAAKNGCALCTEIICSYVERNLRNVLAGKRIITEDKEELLTLQRAQLLFEKMQLDKLKSYDMRVFLQAWCLEAAITVYKIIIPCEQKLISIPTKESVDRAIHFLDPKSEWGYFEVEKTVAEGDKHEIKRLIPIIPNKYDLLNVLCITFKYSFTDRTNNINQTALHLACFENNCDSHFDTIQCLVDRHDCNVLVKDRFGKTSLELLLAERGRLGQPSGSSLHESLISDKRERNLDQIWDAYSLEEQALSTEYSDSIVETCSPPVEIENLEDKEKEIESSYNYVDLLNAPMTDFLQEICGYNEYLSRDIDQYFYVHKETFIYEEAAIDIQRFYRKRNRWKTILNYETNAFFFVKPQAVKLEERKLFGWYRLLQRSEKKEQFSDITQKKWTEFVDPVSSLNFFAALDENVQNKRIFTWCKPAMEGPKKMIKGIPILKVGDSVFYKSFQNDEEKLKYKIIHVNKENGAESYDIMKELVKVENVMASPIAKENQDIAIKRVARSELQKVPKSPEEIKMEIEEAKWKEVLRFGKEKDTRSKKTNKKEDVLKRRYGRKESDENSQGEEKDARSYENQSSSQSVDCRSRKWNSKDDASQIRNSMHKSLKLKPPSPSDHFRKMLPTDSPRLHKFLSEREDNIFSSPRTKSRRNVIRLVHSSMKRQERRYVLCRWGCGQWVCYGQPSQALHEQVQCLKRTVTCPLGCDKKLPAEEWLQEMPETREARYDEVYTRLQFHEEQECPKRLISCPNLCGEKISFIDIPHHMSKTCPKRPSKPLMCRIIGCNKTFLGGIDQALQCHEERLHHEGNCCSFRLVVCKWKGCGKSIIASEMDKHRIEHVKERGIKIFTKEGNHIYEVPERCKQIKVQIWGAGGGSGHLWKYGKGGNGGGGAFIEALLKVSSKEKLYLCVGEGGKHGEYYQTKCKGIGKGGCPGGGDGHGGGGESGIWGGGGGGGYSIIQRKNGKLIPLLVAGGGGGGATRSGLPGEVCSEPFKSISGDVRNGTSGCSNKGGSGGTSEGDGCCDYFSENGKAWRGGNAGDCGGGGGGGLFGGGGGGTAPGIAGGGGGGSSFICGSSLDYALVLEGRGRQPGGKSAINIPKILVKDKISSKPNVQGPVQQKYRLCGEGGLGDPFSLEDGTNGCIKIQLRGFYDDDPQD